MGKYDDVKGDALKDELRKRELSVTGTVEELRARLEENDAEQGGTGEGGTATATSGSEGVGDISLGTEGGTDAELGAQDLELARRAQEKDLGLSSPQTDREAQGSSPMEAAMNARAAESQGEGGATKIHGTGVHQIAEPAPAHATGQGEAPHRHIAEARSRSGIAAPAPTRFDGRDSQPVAGPGAPVARTHNQKHAQDTSES